MDASFIPVEVVPSKTPFGLDQLRRSYKTALSAEAAIAAAPAVGTADETFPFMFLMPISTPESAESATRIDLVYMGCLQDDGEEIPAPILPDQKHDDDDAVLSATSFKGIAPTALTNPFTVQYYGPSEILTWFTFGARGVKGTCNDPTRAIEVITVTCGDINVELSGEGIDELVATWFAQQITDTIQSQEIVPGKYWQNSERKIKTLAPFISSLAPGFYPAPFNAGLGYVVGDVITVTGTGSCDMEVAVVWSEDGKIAQATILTNTLSAATDTPIPATGGSGSGASYIVIEVT